MPFIVLAKYKIILNNIQKDIIIGTILGDSSLERYERSINSRLRIDRTFPHHAEYTMHLFSHLINLCGKGPKVYIRKPDLRNNKIYSSIQFKTLALPSLNYYKDLFYKDGKKIIPANIGDFLTARALAYWIQDDGTADTRGGITLCTDSFRELEVWILIATLKQNFNLDCNKHFKKQI